MYIVPFARYIPHAIIAAISISGTWYIQSTRYELKISQLNNQIATSKIESSNQVIKDLSDIQIRMDNALSSFNETQSKNKAAQQNLDKLLRDLRTTTAGLHGDFSELPAKIANATNPALAEYATACTAVFTRMAERGARMAERGAAIAAKADGHAADAKMMQDLLPEKPTK